MKSGRNPAEFALHSAQNTFEETTPNQPRFVCVVGNYMSSMSRMCGRKNTVISTWRRASQSYQLCNHNKYWATRLLIRLSLLYYERRLIQWCVVMKTDTP